MDCLYVESHNCHHGESAGVKCEGEQHLHNTYVYPSFC